MIANQPDPTLPGGAPAVHCPENLGTTAGGLWTGGNCG